MRVAGRRGAGQARRSTHGDEGGDDNEDAPLTDESVIFFDLD